MLEKLATIQLESKRRNSLQSLSLNPSPSLRCVEVLCLGFTKFLALSLWNFGELRKIDQYYYQDWPVTPL